MPSSLAMASGLTGSRHMPRPMSFSLASSSMSSGSISFLLAVKGFMFPTLEFLGGFAIDFLRSVHETVGAAAGKRSILAAVGLVIFRFVIAGNRLLAGQDAVDE